MNNAACLYIDESEISGNSVTTDHPRSLSASIAMLTETQLYPTLEQADVHQRFDQAARWKGQGLTMIGVTHMTETWDRVQARPELGNGDFG
jgi:hypothetical protein